MRSRSWVPGTSIDGLRSSLGCCTYLCTSKVSCGIGGGPGVGGVKVVPVFSHQALVEAY